VFTIGRHLKELSGYAPELPTPFTNDDCLDAIAFERICDLQIANGATALVVCSTTGEAPNLSAAEHRELIRIAVRASRGRVPIIAGAGSNATAHAIELSKDAEDNGADAILSVVPYYNKPTQEGLYVHFREIAASTTLPLFLYDVPLRTAHFLADETIARLAELPQIIGLKDATGDMSRPTRLRPLLGPDFRLLSGDDATALGFFVQGGDGCISVTSNVAPDICRDLFLAWKQESLVRVQQLTRVLAKLTAALSLESAPVPLKYALSLLGLASPIVRLPLVELSGQTKAAVASALLEFHDKHSLIGKISNAPVGITPRRP
jgi:4-hydroxy-tetrahydrodipicolinate synthase